MGHRTRDLRQWWRHSIWSLRQALREGWNQQPSWQLEEALKSSREALKRKQQQEEGVQALQFGPLLPSYQ